MRREPPYPNHLAVRRQFEPHRLAAQYLAQAYERVAPCGRRGRVAEPRSCPSGMAAGEAARKEAA